MTQPLSYGTILIMERIEISVVVPVFNEEKSVQALTQKLRETLSRTGKTFEIILVDDGSTDKTREIIRTLRARSILLNRNYGQFTAMATGIRKAHGEIVVTMDGDLENDPEDILKLIGKLGEGFDVVCGWRKNRWEGEFFTRRIPSLAANKFISWVTGVYLNDYGCNMKAYRRQILERLELGIYMQRMIAAYASKEGAKVTEIPIGFKPRPFGKSNYGLIRTFRVFFDVITFHFFYKYGRRPMHFFGAVGFWSFFIAFLLFGWMVYLKFIKYADFIKTPLPVLIGIFIMVGFQFILMGLLAELIIRHTPREVEYYEEINGEK